MKNPILAGSIAGIFGGIGATFGWFIAYNTRTVIGIMNLSPELQLPISFWISHVTTEVLIHILFGALFGLIYSKLYDWIPGRGVFKGLIYAFLIYLISNIRPVILFIAHDFSFWTAMPFAEGLSFVGFFVFLFYGIVLGILYKK